MKEVVSRLDGGSRPLLRELFLRASGWLGGFRWLGKDVGEAVVWTGDDMGTEDGADLARCGSSGVDRGFDGGNIAFDHNVAHGTSYLAHGAGECDVGRLEHGVSTVDETGEAASFEDSDCLF